MLPLPLLLRVAPDCACAQICKGRDNQQGAVLGEVRSRRPSGDLLVAGVRRPAGGRGSWPGAAAAGAQLLVLPLLLLWQGAGDQGGGGGA